MRTPRYNRCDFCGRNAHKVAIRMPDGTVDGYCPKCWGNDDDFGAKAQATRRAERQDGAPTIIYDRRRKAAG